jgi:hypothetical protein
MMPTQPGWWMLPGMEDNRHLILIPEKTMTLYHTLYRKMTILIPILPEVPEYAKSQVSGQPPRATFAVIRSTPNGLIPTNTRFNPVHLPEPTLPSGPHPRETPKRSELGASGR